MRSSYKEVEVAFESLRRQFREKAISRREYIDRLKKLRLKDSQGRFWMIGAQSGKWYYFDGRDWVPSDPPGDDSRRAECPSCGLENEGDATTCAGCGGNLRAEEAPPGPGAEESSIEEEVLPDLPQENFVLRRLSATSSFVFSGGIGFVLGLILGAFAGASDFFLETAKSFPDGIGALQGTLMGGIVFSVLGGLLGFALLGAIGYFLALLFNIIAAVGGGFRITLEHAQEKKGKKEDNRTNGQP